MLTIESLKEFGANTEEGLSRCFGNEALYLRLVATVPSEKQFDALEKNVNDGDLKAGFEAAHALKGVLGNLSLTPIYDPVVEITELLRAETQTDYQELLKQIAEKRETLKQICE